ncbi:MAG: aromatic hydrocarbon degradation protein, partial [Saprospiraceae bacterium]|nr:aromatic hydrocarbon degradation protein [Saprospiraceae bacterium]
MKLLTSLTVTLAISFGLSAQTAFDILRFSQFDVGGTARTVGIGGGIGALGADFSVLSTNPAGLAAFRRSELTLTPTLYTSRVTSTLDGAATNLGFNEERSNFNFNNLGLVLAHRPTGSKWSTVNFGIGMNRLA